MGFSYPLPHLEAVLDYEAAEPVAADGTVAPELATVHIPELHTTYTGGCRTHLLDIPDGELLAGRLGHGSVVVIFVIGLLAHAKQFAENRHTVSAAGLRMQVAHCLASDFFLI